MAIVPYTGDAALAVSQISTFDDGEQPSAVLLCTPLEQLADQIAAINRPSVGQFQLTGVCSDGQQFEVTLLSTTTDDYSVELDTIGILNAGTYLIVANGRAVFVTQVNGIIELVHESAGGEPFNSSLNQAWIGSSGAAWATTAIVTVTTAPVSLTFRAVLAGAGTIELVDPPFSIVTIARIAGAPL